MCREKTVKGAGIIFLRFFLYGDKSRPYDGPLMWHILASLKNILTLQKLRDMFYGLERAKGAQQ